MSFSASAETNSATGNARRAALRSGSTGSPTPAGAENPERGARARLVARSKTKQRPHPPGAAAKGQRATAQTRGESPAGFGQGTRTGATAPQGGAAKPRSGRTRPGRRREGEAKGEPTTAGDGRVWGQWRHKRPRRAGPQPHPLHRGKTRANAGRGRACGTQAGAGQGRPQPHEAGTREGPAGAAPGHPAAAGAARRAGPETGGARKGRRPPTEEAPALAAGAGRAPKGRGARRRPPQRGHEPTAEEPAQKGDEPPERDRVRAIGAPGPVRRDRRSRGRPEGEARDRRAAAVPVWCSLQTLHFRLSAYLIKGQYYITDCVVWLSYQPAKRA